MFAMTRTVHISTPTACWLHGPNDTELAAAWLGYGASVRLHQYLDSILQEAAVEYVASTIERLMKMPGKRVYVISTYVIGKEKVLLEVSPDRPVAACCS
jgi:hypothetical protein